MCKFFDTSGLRTFVWFALNHQNFSNNSATMLIFAKQRVSSILLLGRVNHQIQVYVSNIFHVTCLFHSFIYPLILSSFYSFFSVTTTSISMCLVQCVICHMGYIRITCHMSLFSSLKSYVICAICYASHMCVMYLSMNSHVLV